MFGVFSYQIIRYVLKKVNVILEEKAFIYFFETLLSKHYSCITNVTKPMFSSVQLLSCVWLFVTPWTAARQASLSINNSRSLLKLMPIESVMPSNRLILCRPLFLPPSIFSSIRVFSNESVLRIRGPKCWSFSFSISPSSEWSELISFRIDWLDPVAVQVDVLSCKNMRTVLRTFKAMWSIGSDLR